MNKTLLLFMFLAMPAAAAELPQPAVPAVSAQTPPPKKGNRFLEFYIPQMILLTAALAAVSEAAAHKYPQSRRAVRISWNWVLLASFLVCAVLGLTLLVPLEKAVKIQVVHFHLWSGTISLVAVIHHFALRLHAMR